MNPLFFVSTDMDIRPVILEGIFVRLIPMSREHCKQLCEVGFDQNLWRMTTALIRNAEDMRRCIEEALRLQVEGKALPFVTVERTTGKLVGSTRFGSIDTLHRRLEIGWTWIAKPWQRTPVNTEAKYLMLRHAFETLGCIRVEFKTDSLNEQSRNALVRIGAKEEGVLRNHMITPSGRVRDSVHYSIIDTEWIETKKRLEQKLARNPSSGEVQKG
jgi:RimJ/RimL family protein N-acetyltransferase